jgi:hypothetical protein
MCKKLYELTKTLCNGDFQDARVTYEYIINNLVLETRKISVVLDPNEDIKPISPLNDIVKYYYVDETYCKICNKVINRPQDSGIYIQHARHTPVYSYNGKSTYYPCKNIYDVLDTIFMARHVTFTCSTCGNNIIVRQRITKLPEIMIIHLQSSVINNREQINTNNKSISELNDKLLKTHDIGERDKLQKKINELEKLIIEDKNKKMITNDDYLLGRVETEDLRDNNIKIPVEIDMINYMYDKTIGSTKYSLYAVSQFVHGNHYKALIRIKNEWYDCNDSNIVKIKNVEEHIDYDNCLALIIFYKRIH